MISRYTSTICKFVDFLFYLFSYDPNLNPSVATGFTSAAFRVGHTLLPSEIERWSKTHRYVGSQKLSGMLLQPYDLYKEGWADAYLMGMVNQASRYPRRQTKPDSTRKLIRYRSEIRSTPPTDGSSFDNI